MGPSDDLSDVMLFLFVIWLVLMAISGIVTFFRKDKK